MNVRIEYGWNFDRGAFDALHCIGRSFSEGPELTVLSHLQRFKHRHPAISCRESKSIR